MVWASKKYILMDMANDCLYEMKIKGSREAVDRVINCLKADYNYGVGKPEHKHFFRIFNCYDDEIAEQLPNGEICKWIWGYCAWSVDTCMTENGYYADCKKNHPDTFMGTTLAEQSADCEIEVFSEEPGMCFSEHYHYKNGECLVDDVVDATEEENADGEYESINPHRFNQNGEFMFAL